MNNSPYYPDNNPADERTLKNLRRIAWGMMAPFLFLVGAEIFFFISSGQLVTPSAILGMSGGSGVLGIVIELSIIAIFLLIAMGGLLLMRRKKIALTYLHILFLVARVVTVLAALWLIYAALAAFLFFAWPAFFGMVVLFVITGNSDRKLKDYLERPEVQKLLS